MKIQKTSRKKITILVLLTIIVAVLAITSVYVLYFRNSETNQSSQNNQPPTEEQSKAGEQAKKSTLDDDNSQNQNQNVDDTTSTDKTPSGSTAPSNPQSNNATITITASNQNGSIYQLRSLIAQATIPNGSCDLELTKGDVVVRKTATITALAQSSTCQGFDIPTSELSAGTWSVKLSFNGGGYSGSTTSSIEVR